MTRMLSAIFLYISVTATARAADAVDYRRDVQPVLARHCLKCHGATEQKSDLRLDSAAGALTGGNAGPAIVAGKSSESLLIDAVTKAENTSAMPPEGSRLSAVEVDVLRRWIDAGAKAPADDEPQPAVAPAKSSHWAYQPLAKVETPQVKKADWVRNPIDAFILAKLEAAGLEPSPEADPVTLCRRLYLDLTGLPPSPAEVEDFVSSYSRTPAPPHPRTSGTGVREYGSTGENAYAALVDKLLASPHYGERWGRLWLDLARYADSNGYTIDSGRNIWKYRDWVIEAFNRDLPFDQFTIEQIAGDMLPQATTDQIVATGFHRNTLKNEEGGTDQEQFRVEAVVDRVSTTGSVFLGLTVGCARCHDHKYDKLSQREFYQLFALLNNADEPTLPVPTTQQVKEEPAIAAEIEQVDTRIETVLANSAGRQREWEERLTKQFAELEKSGAAPDVLGLADDIRKLIAVPEMKRTAAQKKALLEEYKKHDIELVPLNNVRKELLERQQQLKAKITTTLVMQERRQPRDTHVHLRGDFLRQGAKVVGGVPAVLPPLKPAGGKANRLDFARWLVDKENPLTPRVTVNRVWQTYFGQGIVGTENDFGTQGDVPTHPELLDWLAMSFAQGSGVRGQGAEVGGQKSEASNSSSYSLAPGPSPLTPIPWSMKSLHRLIVTSATYRQASRLRRDVQEKDPYNKLLARQSRLRLDAELVRDAALTASGLLTREIGGPGVYPPQPEGIYRFTQQVKYWKESTGDDRYRRTMYTYFWRSSPYPLLTTFDAPDGNTTCTRRPRSNTPLQALTLANDRSFIEIAQGLAARILRESESASDEERIRRGIQLCLARDPNDREARTLRDFVAAQRMHFAEHEKEAESVAPKTRPNEVSVADAAAWTAVARVLLNLDEFVSRE